MAARRNFAETARGLLALLPHLTRGAEIPLQTLASAVGRTTEEVAEDLATLSMCGLPPFTPYEMIDLEVDGEVVRVWGDPPALGRRVRLSSDEARALASALQACGRDESDPLAAKLLAAASGTTDADELARTVRAYALPGGAADVYTTVASAIEESAALRIEYFSAGSGETRRRVVHPLALSSERGAWYLTARCASAGDERTFRLDRVRSAERTGETFPAAGKRAPLPVLPGSKLPVAEVRFAPGQRVDERDLPRAAFEPLPEGGVLARVPYAGTGWLARRVAARLGAAEVVLPPDVRAATASLAEQEARLGRRMGA